MLTVKEHAAWLPLGSRALKVIKVVPVSRVDPDIGLQETSAFPELSVTLGSVYTNVAVHESWSDGQVWSTGFLCLSLW